MKDGEGPEFEDMSKNGGIGYVNGERSYNEVISQDGDLEHSQAELKAGINLADSESLDGVNGLQTRNPTRLMGGGNIQVLTDPESPPHHRTSEELSDAIHFQSGTNNDVDDSELPPNSTNGDANNRVHLHSGANSDENDTTQICRGVDRDDNDALPLQSGTDGDADDVMRMRSCISSDASDVMLPQSGISKGIIVPIRRGTSNDVKCAESGMSDNAIHTLNGHCPSNSTSDDIPDDSMCADAMNPRSSTSDDADHHPSSRLEDDAMPPQSGTSLSSTLGEEMQPLSSTLDMEMPPLSSTLDMEMPPQSGISDNAVLDQSGKSDDVKHLQNGKSNLVACLQNGTCLGGAPSDDVTPIHCASCNDVTPIPSAPSSDVTPIKASPSDDMGPSDLTPIRDGHTNVVMTHVQSADPEAIEEGNTQVQNYDHTVVRSPLPHDMAALPHRCYPAPLATHEAVVKDRELFMNSLGGFLAALGTRLT
jgi:hypothetical protein